MVFVSNPYRKVTMSATMEFDKAAFEQELKRYARWQSRIKEVQVDFADEPDTMRFMTQRFQMCLNLSGHNLVNLASGHGAEATAVANEMGFDIELP